MKRKLAFYPFAIIFLFLTQSYGQPKKYSDYPISMVQIKSVEISDNFWLPIIKTVQNTTIPFGIEKCRTEGRLENFLIAGGKKEGKVKGQMPFDDTDIYKIIENLVADNSKL